MSINPVSEKSESKGKGKMKRLLTLMALAGFLIANTAKADVSVRLKLYVDDTDKSRQTTQVRIEKLFLDRLAKINNMILTNGDCDAYLSVRWVMSGNIIAVITSFRDVYFSRQ
jgi:hypothetical protein